MYFKQYKTFANGQTKDNPRQHPAAKSKYPPENAIHPASWILDSQNMFTIARDNHTKKVKQPSLWRK